MKTNLKTEENTMYTIQSSAMEFKNHKVYEYTLAGRPLVIETGKLAGLANGSCL